MALSRRDATALGVITLLLALTAWAALSAHHAANAAREAATTPNETVGRFQILSARYHWSEDDKGHESVGLFRVDTVTGDTWIYVSTINKGRSDSEWLPMRVLQLNATR